VESDAILIGVAHRIISLRGPFLVSRTGDMGCPGRVVKKLNC